VNKQDSTLEHIKYQLADLTVRSRKIEQDQEKKSLLRHNKQMEEIRNRHVCTLHFYGKPLFFVSKSLQICMMLINI